VRILCAGGAGHNQLAVLAGFQHGAGDRRRQGRRRPGSVQLQQERADNRCRVQALAIPLHAGAFFGASLTGHDLLAVTAGGKDCAGDGSRSGGGHWGGSHLSVVMLAVDQHHRPIKVAA